MSKKTKLLFIGLITGLAGIAVTIGIAIGTDALMSREDFKVYRFDEPFNTVVFPEESERCPVGFGGVEGDSRDDEYKVEAYIKAWRPEHIDIDDILTVEVSNGELFISKRPFPDDFLGLFPQPYELSIDIYTPLGVELRWE